MRKMLALIVAIMLMASAFSAFAEEIIPEDAVRVLIEKAPEKGFDYRKITVKAPEEKK